LKSTEKVSCSQHRDADFTPDLHQTKNGDLGNNHKSPISLPKHLYQMVPKAGFEPARA
jgi:hypothetical protein